MGTCQVGAANIFHCCVFGSATFSPLALASVAAGCDGLIIEMHPNPKKSAVDPLQPLDFKEFANLKKKLKKIASILGKKII